jgi:hypothetical protein
VSRNHYEESQDYTKDYGRRLAGVPGPERLVQDPVELPSRLDALEGT